jgi:hypothetical protein
MAISIMACLNPIIHDRKGIVMVAVPKPATLAIAAAKKATMKKAIVVNIF